MLTLQGGDSLVGGLPIIHITYQQYIANPSAYQDPDVIVHISGFPTAGNMPADYVGYDSTLNMEDIGNIATKAIAKVEPSDTALYLHEVGEYFINKDGNACKADIQIPVNGTITLGTNCHVLPKGVANDINSNLSKNYFDNVVDLSSYTTLANAYVAPDDGYINIGIASNSTLDFIDCYVVSAYGNNNALEISNARPTTGWNNVALPIKKGMRIHTTTGVDSRAFMSFRKLI